MRSLIMFCCFSLIFNALSASSLEDQRKAKMIQDLEIIKHHLEVGYAPAEWKKEHFGWDLETEFEKSKNQVLETSPMTTKQFQKIVRQFLASTKDHHVGVVFCSTEAATLPFSVKGIEDRYFISWVDPLRLPFSYYGIQVGDELLEFGGRPIATVVEELIEERGRTTNPKTDQAMAAAALTDRIGATGDEVPQGTILIKTRSNETGKLYSCQLMWAYTAEHVKDPLDFLQPLNFLGAWKPISQEKEKPKTCMINPVHEHYAQKMTGRRGELGAYKSFLPPLGNIIWTREDEDSSEEGFGCFCIDLNWYAYIYQHPAGHAVGYIRIPHYLGMDSHAKKFGEILAIMQEKTDALVIDQLNNFGGWVHFQNRLLSMLINEPLKTPYHRIKINQRDVFGAYQDLEMYKMMDLIFNSFSNDESSSVEEDEDSDLGFSFFNHQEILFRKALAEFILSEWDAGRRLTRPTPIEGVDMINPHPYMRYTKPIVMLINELDISGGDFLPATLQDGRRAILFGGRTAGAGGYVNHFEFPNVHGILRGGYTGSIAERANVDSQKIEDLGVHPDVKYELTVKDLQEGYQGYVDAVNETVYGLLKMIPEEERVRIVLEEEHSTYYQESGF